MAQQLLQRALGTYDHKAAAERALLVLELVKEINEEFGAAVSALWHI